MPTYQYACTECDHRFDAVQSFSDSALTECPECSGRLRKLYGAVGVVFKGSGFYRTDSRSSSSGAPAAAKTESAPAKTESTSTSTSTSSSTSTSTSTSTPAAAAS
ncbi:putative FmdB family regulatory protein [Saccharothrix ecbatanensis]|uniref:Putative FmdB family regulatory protein n=1 Tax=Saccharothrix ecbatanensis TaxID=1105145 RepID=A0A7W9HS77_9PSEU|nr:FmdB family zinc ribbon protein [Saccharothrix ecbatanensis]MBB5807517.1 putative FmdB family regulatory protein [Saccharothrix ecbatanensis]